MTRRMLRLAAALAVLGAMVVPLTASAEDGNISAYAWGMANPRGLSIDPNTGSLIVSTLGTGNPSRRRCTRRSDRSAQRCSNSAETCSETPSTACIKAGSARTISTNSRRVSGESPIRREYRFHPGSTLAVTAGSPDSN